MFVCFLTNIIMCRWLLFPNRCAMLPFSWAICGLFNRMINFWISVFPSVICSTVLHDRTGTQAAAHREMQVTISAPSFRKWALALLCKVQAKWAPLPLALSTVVLESATVKKGGWRMAGGLLLKRKQGQIWWAGLRIYCVQWIFVFSTVRSQNVVLRNKMHIYF